MRRETKKMSEQVVKDRRDKILPFMICPICNKLLKEATTIKECMHTFCENCIYKKLKDDAKDCCPVCNTHLGSNPKDKLRQDHNLDDISRKIFPDKKIVVNASESVFRASESVSQAPESALSIPKPTRRKKGSLSSLVVSAPPVSTKTVMTGRRTAARRAVTSPESSLWTDGCVQKEEVLGDGCPESSGSGENLAKIIQNKGQHHSTANPNKHLSSDEDTENGAEPSSGEINLRELLDCLPEAEKGPKPEAPARKANKGRAAKSEASAPELAKPQKMRRNRRKRDAATEELETSSQATTDTAGFEHSRRPIWHTLLASDEQDQGLALPQIPKCYLRVRDGSAPISSVQQYIAKKIDLTSESEVEITCQGQPVLPTVHLHDLVDFWLQTTPMSRRIQPSVGSSSKDFMMVLTNRRKFRPT